jgi:hypothetical protein
MENREPAEGGVKPPLHTREKSKTDKRREVEALGRKSPPFPVKNTGTQRTRINLGWGTLKSVGFVASRGKIHEGGSVVGLVTPVPGYYGAEGRVAERMIESREPGGWEKFVWE